MIKIKHNNQKELFDPWFFIIPKRKKILENSWAGFFVCEILKNYFLTIFKDQKCVVKYFC